MTEFKVGDLVRVLDNQKISPAVLTDGEVYEVIDVDMDGDFYVIDDEGDKMSILDYEFPAVEKLVLNH